MRRSSALLASAALSAPLFVVPGTAHADATDVGPALAVEVDKQATTITAQLAPGLVVQPSQLMTVRGRVVWRSSALPVAGAEVQVDVPDEIKAPGGDTRVQTSDDGTFRASFTAGQELGKSGTVTARVLENDVLAGSQVSLGTMNIRNGSQIAGFDAAPEPLAYRDPIIVHGRLYVLPDSTKVTNLPLYLEYSLDGRTWKVWASQTLGRPSHFSFDGGKPVTKDADWRVRYPGSVLTQPVVSEVDHVDVKYRTDWSDFNASPEPVKKGKAITVKGRLYRFRDKPGPGPNAPVYVYFKAAGTTTYRQVAATKTDSKGWFTKTFKASVDGTWKAVYKETSGYIGSSSAGDAVDVR
ncbi:hypothetical protein [Actinomadura sp. WMMA1423]|uniref:hypothetical protein n=1 Tax=Actinomadura sp. WMMA1423 TaxID=2591108 RepID=UPI001146C0B7|nr:hypothetical protein [Actinomadura sp. WMMA1423]